MFVKSVPRSEALLSSISIFYMQVMSVIGGLLLMIEKGPGDISYDEYKKTM